MKIGYGVLELSKYEQNFKVHSDSKREPRQEHKTIQNKKSI
jgi:hypothetical protein